MQLILVDDDPISRRLLSAQLRALGYNVAEYEDGQDAWDALQHSLVPLIISDWQMPGLDGPGLVQRIRAAELPGYVYCILLTAPGEPSDRMLGLEIGADDYLTKPIAADDLQSRLTIATRILRLEQELRAAQGAKAMLSNEIRQIATRDALTGLLARPAILAHTNEQLTSAIQHGTQLHLALIHLEGLPAINLAHGYASGDSALRHVARALASEPEVQTGRWSAATFLAVITDRSHSTAHALAKKWQQLVAADPVLLEDQAALPIAATIQIATLGPEQQSLEQHIESLSKG